jgi:hypothetical protein
MNPESAHVPVLGSLQLQFSADLTDRKMIQQA